MTEKTRISLAIPDLRGREVEFLTKCVHDNWVSSAGPDVTALEQSIAQLTGRRHAIATVNGTAALHLALMAAGVRRGDKVIVPDWTFAATVNAVMHAGALPIFVDVTPEDWSLDPLLVKAALTKHPDVKAILAVDPVGHAADYDALTHISENTGIPLIEDAAGAIGASYKGRPCGSFGLASTFSFNGNKTLTAGGGGMVLTDDDDVARIVKHRSTQARPGPDYVHDEVGYNYRMTNINAALGMAQFERLGEMIDRKQAIARRYDEVLDGQDDVRAMPRPASSTSSCWLYCVRVASEASARSLVALLADENIEARIFWRSLSAQAPWIAYERYLNGVSAALSGTVVSLPCSSSLSVDEQDRVIAVLNKWCASKAIRVAS